MSAELIKYAFVAGELSPTFYGRSDLEKYDLGLAIARNWFVDYRGGLSTRPGTEFVDFVQHDDQPTRYFVFKYAPNVANTNIILFGQGYIRFLQDGAYVLEDGLPITAISQAEVAVVGITAHGLSDGDWGYISDVEGMTGVNGGPYEVADATTDNFTLKDQFGNPVSTLAFSAYTSGGEFNRIYTLESPYDVDDLDTLKAYQKRDLVRLTHPDYPIKNLTRLAAASWTIEDEEIGNNVTRPTGLAGTASDTGLASVGYQVTAVVDGEESLPSEMVILATIVDFASTAGSVNLTWTKVTGAQYYNVYRTKIQSGVGATPVALTKAEEVGYIGRAYAPVFLDTNIIPDFVSAPPEHENPFANSAIEAIEIVNDGSGYSKTDTVSVSGGGGSGFVGYPIVDSSGNVVAVKILNGGQGYSSNPSVTFSGGSGATTTERVGEPEGNYPRVSAVFQQRQAYAASHNKPLTIWAGQPGRPSNFDVSAVVTDGDAFEFELDSEEVSPIEHLVPQRGGLLMLSNSGIWTLRSGTTNEAVTPLQALADPQSYRGCSTVPPLAIDTDILYVEGRSPTVRLLSYNDFSKLYSGQDVSILSNHLFSPSLRIIRWGYALNPYNLIYAVRSDGKLLAFTLVKEQDVYAWTLCQTKGQVLDIAVVQEDNVDSVYLMVRRFVNGRWTKFIERMAQRSFERSEDAWCVDCGLSLPITYPDAELTPYASTGSGITFEASAAVFEVGDIGKFIRVGHGKAEVVAYTSPTQVVVDIVRDIALVTPEDPDNTPLPAASGEWSMDTPTSTLQVPHLVGQTIQILADGNVISDVIVPPSGEVEIDFDATRIIAGLGYQCVARTLPLTATQAVIEAKRKRLVGTSVRIHDTRGLKQGSALDNLYEMKERTTEVDEQPVFLQEGVKYVLIESNYDENGQVYYVQDFPLPATILMVVADVEVGDDSD